MKELDELLRMEGVVAAGKFTNDGELEDYRATMNLSPELAEMTAQFSASVTMMFTLLAGSFSRLSEMRWIPQHFWSYSGGNWTVAVGGHYVVFVETAKADLNRLREVMSSQG